MSMHSVPFKNCVLFCWQQQAEDHSVLAQGCAAPEPQVDNLHLFFNSNVELSTCPWVKKRAVPEGQQGREHDRLRELLNLQVWTTAGGQLLKLGRAPFHDHLVCL